MAKSPKQASTQSLEFLTRATSTYQWPTEVSPNPNEILQEQALEIFAGVIETGAKWSKPQILMAARYALLTVEADLTMQRLLQQGWVSTKLGQGGREIETVSPHAQALEKIQGELIRLANKLSLGANSQDGDLKTRRNQAAAKPARLAASARTKDDAEIDWVALAEKEGS